MPFGFFDKRLLFSLDGHHRVENPKANGIVWLQIHFCLNNVEREIPVKRSF